MIRKARSFAVVLAAVAAGVVLSAAFNLSPRSCAFWGEGGKGKGKVQGQESAPVGAGLSGRLVPADIPTLFKAVSPAVVNISTTQVIRFNRPAARPRSPFGRDPFDEFFGNFFGNMPKEQKRRSLGSGFIVSEDGYILTNNHVVEKGDEVTVTLLNKEEFKAEVVGTDQKTDMALVKIQAGKKLPFVALGDSEKLEIGEWVVAIGNPFGLGHTVTTGIVSAKGRIIGSGPYDDFIQTDASINPGNSGGPLFNLKGEVVGINTAIVQGGQGIGFAIPVHLARPILSQLKEKGKVTRAWLGVHVQPLTPELAERLDVPGRHGGLVADVNEGSPADKAGLRSGDVIVSFDGKAVESEHELPAMVASTPVGKKVEVRVLRDGKEVALHAVLAELEDGAAKGGGAPDAITGLGLTVQDITPEMARHFNIRNTKGVFVSAVEEGSAADQAGFEEADIVRQVNRQPVEGVASFEKVLRGAKGEKTVLFLVERGEARIFLALKNK
jgi:serine protease Do